MALLASNRPVSGWKSCLSSGYPDRELTDFALSEFKATAKAQGDEMGHCLLVPVMGCSGAD